MINDTEAMDPVREALMEEFVSEADPLAKRDKALGRIIDAVERSGRPLIGFIDYEPGRTDGAGNDNGARDV